MDRVQRVHAYSDLSLHHYLVHSALSAADRALATELVNLGEAAFRRDLSTPQARRDFKVGKMNRGLRSGGVVS